MKQYQDLLRHILVNGKHRGDRTGTGTQAVFGYQMRFNLNEGFPLVTTKKVALRAVIHELLWFLKGSTNNEELRDATYGPNSQKNTIWEEWALESDQLGLCHSNEVYKKGELGPIYGKQWRSWQSHSGEVIDQIQILLDGLKNKPTSRRHIVSAWNPADLPDESISPKNNVACGKMALAPCHALFQFFAEPMTEDERIDWAWKHRSLDMAKHEESCSIRLAYTAGHSSNEEIDKIKRGIDVDALDVLDIPRYNLSCQLFQRSTDVFLGLSFNIASYALLTMMVAQEVNMGLGEFIWTGGDTHIYNNHMDQVDELLTREPKELPRMKLNPNVKSVFDFKYEDFTLIGYDPHPAISAPVAI